MIIGLTGKAGSGKTMVADYLVMYHMFYKKAFADRLKSAAKLIYGLTQDQVYGSDKDIVDERTNLTPRFILQRLGTEVVRNIHHDTWVMALRREIESTNNDCVIEDVRFLNEAEMIKDMGGILIRVIREERNISDIDNQHQSETELELIAIDFTLDNNESKQELFNIMDKFITINKFSKAANYGPTL